jgi:hypothetical protein
VFEDFTWMWIAEEIAPQVSSRMEYWKHRGWFVADLLLTCMS